jgi:hypothetical protein
MGTVDGSRLDFVIVLPFLYAFGNYGMQCVGHAILFPVVDEIRVFQFEMNNGVGMRTTSSSRDVAIGAKKWLDAWVGPEFAITRIVLG